MDSERGFCSAGFLACWHACSLCDFLPCAQVSMMELTFRPTTHPLAYAHGRRLSQPGSVDAQVAQASNFARLPRRMGHQPSALGASEGGLGGPSSRPLGAMRASDGGVFCFDSGYRSPSPQCRSPACQPASEQASDRPFPGEIQPMQCIGKTPVTKSINTKGQANQRKSGPIGPAPKLKKRRAGRAGPMSFGVTR